MDNLIQELSRALDLKREDTTLYGKFDDFYIRINVLNEQHCSVLISAYSDEAPGDVFGYLENKKHDGIINEYTIHNGFVRITYRIDNEYNVTLNNLLRELTELLRGNNFTTVCIACNEPRTSSFYEVNGDIQNLCASCSSRIEHDITSEINKPGNYLIGFLGALAGALVGSLLWIAIGYIGFYASIAGYAIAYASFYGYNLVKGLNSKAGVAINIISIVLALLVAEYVGIILQIPREYRDFSVVQYISITSRLLSAKGFQALILRNLGLGLVFAGLGSYKVIRTMLGNARKRESLSFRVL